jgi:uncharacterized protein
MHFFFDTSALVKLFSDEKGSSIVKDIIDSTDNTIWISDLVRVEIHSAILRKYRNKEINADELETILKGIDEQLAFFQEIYMAGDIIAEASSLILKFGTDYGLRTLDAIHLACRQLHSERKCTFITSDKVQADVGKEIEDRIVFV